jgi:uncharacterized protein (DUF849 family)
MSEPPSPDIQPRWDVPEKVVVRAAVSGRSAREATAARNNFALDIESFARQAVEAIEAGSAGIHLDVGGIVTTRGQERRPSVYPYYEKIVSHIASRTQRDWVPDVNILHGETFKENLLPITSGLGETTMMAPDNPPEWMEGVARVVTDYGKRLFFAVHSAAEVELAERLVIRKGILEKPYCWCVLIGYVYDETTNRIATYMPHPKAMIQELTLLVDRILEIEEDCYIEVCGAGRAAQYLCALAVLMGLHVRMGTEDTVWRYPHKDEPLSEASENVRRTKTIAEQLGRELATAEDFRKILRIK